jgi:NADPH2:quinone reductase
MGAAYGNRPSGIIDPDGNRANFEAVFAMMRAGKLHPRVDATYAFADAPQAIADLHERRLVGKGVVRIREG